ncbi:UPF0182 family protein [Tomitella cavernea]|uniref:UPF0182 family protein n=1 Tax=Tomitella cavernea TaxID=1387982 RepID=UPI001903B9AC|nr:UPF0182 family protein [Tomitella cavernea]
MSVRPPGSVPRLSRRSKILIGIGVALIVLLLVGPRLIDTYISWEWFKSLGFGSVYSTVLWTRIITFLVVGLVVGGIIFAAIVLAYRMRPVFVPMAGEHDVLARYRALVMSRRKTFGLAVPVLVGLISGLVAQSDWQMIQLFLHAKPFDDSMNDPQFDKNIGFYAFELPFIKFVLTWLFVALIVSFFASLVTHYLFGGIRLAGRSGSLTRAARAQLAIIAGVFLLLKAVAYWFDRYSLLSSTDKYPMFTGAGYTDINAVLPSKMILLAIAVICAAVFFAAIVLRDLRIPALAVALMVFSSVIIGAVYPLIVEQFSVKPNAAQKEAEYIKRNITATRAAYGITDANVDYVKYAGVGTKSPQDVPADETTVENLRLLDPNILSPTFTQQMQLKNFYGFPKTLSIDRYMVDGELRDFIVAARGLNPQSLTGNQTDWINQHTVYTHGNGFVAAQANTIRTGGDEDGDAGGYPVYQVSDLSTKPTIPSLEVDNPRIYFGELISNTPDDYAIVGAAGDEPREYDSETGERYTYQGSAGVSVGNWFNRLAFAVKYTERNFLFSDAIGDDSKILFNRDPRDRVKKVAPWLTTDTSAYPAVIDGKIKWIVDAYTTLENYPYAQRSSLAGLMSDSIDAATGRPLPQKEVSYIRNSVKATVDAFDGTVTLYQVDKNDPVLNTWMDVFPGVVKPESAITPELRAHFRYPEDLFKVQREMLAKYHVDDPNEFFTNNAFWSVPSDPTVDTDANQPPYYVLRGDPETAEPQFDLTSPMRGYQREFLSAYISVSSDPKEYGQFTVLTLPTDTQTQGPGQMQNSMRSDSKVSQDVALLGQTNTLTFGNMLTLPIADGGILYVEPLYTEQKSTSGNTFPRLSRVLMSYTDPNGVVKVGYAPTASEALKQIFGPGVANLATREVDEGGAPVEPATTPAPGGDQAGGGAPSPSPSPTPAPTTPPPARGDEQAAVQGIDSALKNLQSAQSTGNFGDYGKALENLQKAIENYEKVTGNTGG